MSIIRSNLMNRKGYSPYCGEMECTRGIPRTSFNGNQFKCGCGWESGFDAEFISKYKKKWGLK